MRSGGDTSTFVSERRNRGCPSRGEGGERPGPLPALGRDPTHGDADRDRSRPPRPLWHPGARGCPAHPGRGVPASDGGWKLVSLEKGESVFFLHLRDAAG